MSLGGPTGSGEHAVADVVLDDELGVFDPDRVVDAQRHVLQAPSPRRQQVHPVAHSGGDVLAGQQRHIVGFGGELEEVDADRSLLVGLDEEEPRIAASKPLHVREHARRPATGGR